MPNLACRSGQPGIQASILHDAGTNARSHEDADEVVVSAARTVEIFTESGNFDIVSHTNRDAEILAKNIPQRHIFHAQIGSIDNNTSFSVDLSSSTDADSNISRAIRQFGGIQRRCCQFSDTPRDKVLSTLGTSTLAGRTDNFTRCYV